MTRSDIVERTNCDVKAIDSGLKNKWRWEWLEVPVDKEKPELGKLGDFVKKIRKPGLAWCQPCDKEIKYASSGTKALAGHGRCDQHIKNKKTVSSNYLIPGTN